MSKPPSTTSSATARLPLATRAVADAQTTRLAALARGSLAVALLAPVAVAVALLAKGSLAVALLAPAAVAVAALAPMAVARNNNLHL